MKEVKSNFHNSKKIWATINTLCGKINKSIDEIIIKHFKLLPNVVSNKFASEFRNNVKNTCKFQCNTPILDDNCYINKCHLSMRLQKAKEEVVSFIIKHLNERKCPGFDGIRVKDLKYIHEKITPVITHLINRCIATSSYPDQLKIGIVRPIHKNGSYKDVNNYRPITILSCIDKIIERYLGLEINNYLTKNNVINDKQYGFQKNKNTSQLLSNFSNGVNKCLNNREHVLVVLIDFSKAFDCLEYNTLFNKLEQNGIRGPLLDWFKNYHKNRYTSVCVAGSLSSMVSTDKGTAQGSIIGPTEYLLYVNDMCNIFTEGSVYQFADDTCLVAAHKDIREAQRVMQCNFDLLCKWAHDVGLVINTKKTKLIYIHSPYLTASCVPSVVAHEHLCLHRPVKACSCSSLELVTQHMYLGLIIDSNFHWRPHIDHVCNKLRSILAKLSILKYKLPYKILRTLYLALADSVIDYGLSSYGRTYKTYIEDIYKLQLRILKTIVPKKIKQQFQDDDSGLFKHCQIVNVFDKVRLRVISENCHNILNIRKYERLKSLRCLTYLPTFIIPKSNNIYGTRTWECMLPSYLNDLPIELCSKINPKNCQKILKKYFLDCSAI